MSDFKKDIEGQTDDKPKTAQPKTPFIKYLNRAGGMASNPYYDMPENDRRNRPRNSRQMYEACWLECVSMELTAAESYMIRINLGEFYHRKYPERVQFLGDYKYALRDPATVTEISDRQREAEGKGFKPESLRLPHDTVTPQELLKAVKIPPVPGRTEEEMPF